MREIKFRVWDNKRNFMDYEPQITIDMGYINNIGVVDCNGDFRPYKYEIIMQYIGLKDKNGKEIYEGDIIKCKDICGEYSKELYNEVVNDMCDWLYNYGYASQELLRYDEIEVIGNIYENPELLGDKK